MNDLCIYENVSLVKVNINNETKSEVKMKFSQFITSLYKTCSYNKILLYFLLLVKFLFFYFYF